MLPLMSLNSDLQPYGGGGVNHQSVLVKVSYGLGPMHSACETCFGFYLFCFLKTLNYHSFREPNVYLAQLQMELCRAANKCICSPLKSKVSILRFC